MTRELLIKMARDVISHGKANTIAKADDFYKMPSSVYFDKQRNEDEKNLIFKRIPIVLGPSAEIPNVGDFKTMDIVNTPIIISRSKDGSVKGFMNTCMHRGSPITFEESGNTMRFTCPYHGWTYNNDGKLMGIASEHDFGDVDKECFNLISFPVYERAGIIWGILNPSSEIDFDSFIQDYDNMISHFGFENWSLFAKRTISGPNWKAGYDGYLDIYHVPVLHKNTFGPNTSNRPLYYSWGPHQRVCTVSLSKDKDRATLGYMSDLVDLEEKDWDIDTLLYGVWTVFPHASIASFLGGGKDLEAKDEGNKGNRGVMLSVLYPGDDVNEHFTTQYYLMENPPTDEEGIANSRQQFDLLEEIVGKEDYNMGKNQVKSLMGGGLDELTFGLNEKGNQNFYKWVDEVLNAKNDKELNKFFKSLGKEKGIPLDNNT